MAGPTALLLPVENDPMYGYKLKTLLDGLKGPITKVGDLVRKAKAEQGEKKN